MKATILFLLVSILTALGQSTNLVLTLSPAEQFQVGSRYVKGDEPAKMQEGMSLLRKSASAGNVDSMLALGKMLRDSDVRESIKYYRMAAAKGNTDAANETANLVIQGPETLKEPRTEKERYVEAIRYFEIAARNGDKGAANRLAYIYLNGNAGFTDQNKAINYLLQARNYGGVAHALNNAVRPDLVRAYSFARVDYQVNGGSMDLAKKLALKMTPDQIKQGEQLGVQFMKANKLSFSKRD